MEKKTAEQIVKALADWSNKYPRGRIYPMSKQSMDNELIAIENDAKAYASQLPVEGERDDKIIKFLLGECDYDGVWFGDQNNKAVAPFWWRRYLRKYLEPQAPDNNVK